MVMKIDLHLEDQLSFEILQNKLKDKFIKSIRILKKEKGFDVNEEDINQYIDPQYIEWALGFSYPSIYRLCDNKRKEKTPSILGEDLIQAQKNHIDAYHRFLIYQKIDRENYDIERLKEETAILNDRAKAVRDKIIKEIGHIPKEQPSYKDWGLMIEEEKNV